MFLLPTVSHPTKITDQLVPFPASVVTSSAVLRLLAAEMTDPGARMRKQSAAMVCSIYY